MVGKIYSTIFNFLNNFFLRRDNILVSVSGGIDSMVLLNLLITFNPKLLLHVAHANFKLRVPYSNHDEFFVKKFCLNNNIIIHIKKFNTINYANKKACSIQMAARYLRYHWVKSLSNKLNCKYIAMGHQFDDVLETFVINIIRGTGIKGLLSIPNTRENLIRPMLKLSREDILQYAKLKKIIWREDHSNKENHYQRNKIRNNIIPLLSDIDYNNIYKMINKTITNIQDDYIILNNHIETTFSQITIKHIHNPFYWEIDINKLKELIPLKSYLFKFFFTYGFTKNLEKILFSTSGKQMSSKKFRIIKDRNCLLLTCNNQKYYNYIYRIDQINYITKTIGLTFRLNCLKVKKNNYSEFIDFDEITLPLYIRTWRNRDNYYPLGMKNKKKISKLFKDKKMTLLEKEQILLLLNYDGTIIMIMPFWLDNRFKITYNTKNILNIMYNNHPNLGLLNKIKRL